MTTSPHASLIGTEPISEGVGVKSRRDSSWLHSNELMPPPLLNSMVIHFCLLFLLFVIRMDHHTRTSQGLAT